MTKYKYKISVIVPIYNVENYLSETIESVIHQTIGFKKNIQLILINDGSPDDSETICLKYKNKYPNNIVYVKQKNSGVSAARNHALDYVEGEYVNFLDSDDKWDRDAFKKGYKMFVKHPEINLICYRIKNFEAQNNYHVLDYKFQNGDRLVDLNDEYTYVQLSSCSTLIRATALKNKKFNTTLKMAEDARLLTEIVFDNMKVGIISSSKYNYRRRKEHTSAIQSSTKKKTWYLDTPTLCHQYLFDLSKQKFGHIIPYVQYLVLYDLQWRLFIPITPNILTKQEETKYLKILGKLLKNIDDEIIKDFHFIQDDRKLYLLNYKYKGKAKIQLDQDLIIKNCALDFNQIKLLINNTIIKKNELSIYCSMLNVHDIYSKIYIVDEKGSKHLLKEYELDRTNKNFRYVNKKYVFTKKGLVYKIDLNKYKKFSFAILYKKQFIPLNVGFNFQSKITKKFASVYLRAKNYYVKYNKKNNYFYVQKKTTKNTIKNELSCIYNLLRKRKWKILFLRELANLYHFIFKKEIWIVSDRLNIASDNGEAFFDFLIKKNCKSRKCYFLISKTSNDYKRLKEKYRKHLLSVSSFKYKLLFLNSSKIISAHADEYVTNPFSKDRSFLCDLFQFQFVFLQHGIIMNDLSTWLNINNKTIDLFITSSEKERQSIIDYKYNFDKKNIVVTGLARYDYLNNKKQEKVVLIMPTWRKSIASKIDLKTGNCMYNEEFKNTDYFKFYNALINNKKLITYVKTKGYKIRFIPHNNILQQLSDFTKNDQVEFADGTVIYREEFNRCSLLVTDYSSVFFDVSYLKKPIIYCQFDHTTFFEGQIYDKGYFDYIKDGFGPVCYDIDKTVDQIIKYIDQKCVVEKKYLQRIEAFYKYTDKNNCKRIYNAIKNLDKK